MADTRFKTDVHSKTSQEWAGNKYRLARGDIGVESDTGRQKVGIGAMWADTPYQPIGRGVLDVQAVSTEEYVSGEVNPGTVYITSDDNANMFLGELPVSRNLDWRLVGKHFWPAFEESMQNTAAGPAITATLTFGPEAVDGINGGCLLPDGRVFLLAKSAGSVSRIYDPATDEYTDVGVDFTAAPFAAASNVGALPLPDGTVFIVPYALNAKPAVYDPATDDYEIVGDGWASPINQAAYHAIVMQDGDIFMAPRKALTAFRYHWRTKTVSVVATPFTVAPGFRSGVLMPDGRIFCAPYEKNNPHAYDPATGTWEALPTTSGNYATCGCCLLADGRIYMPPFQGVGHVYDPLDNTTTATAARPATMNSNAAVSAALLPDGKVLLGPWGNQEFHTYDPDSDTYDNVGSGAVPADAGYYNTLISLPDGRVGGWVDGANATTPILPVFYGSTERAYDRNVLLSPYKNGSR